MKIIINDTATYFVGKYYTHEVNGSNTVVKKYYTAGAKTIAMRTIEGNTNTLNWLLTDPLGSTSVSANEDGSWNSTIKYTAFGCPCAARRVLRNTRETSGVTPTKYRYTGQLLEAEVGLYYYVARFYEPVTMHFTQADTVVQGFSFALSYNRYSYVLYNPINANDPSGHVVCDEEGNCYNKQGWYRSPTAKKLSTSDTWKMMMRSKFGITMSDNGEKTWDNENLHLMYISANIVDKALNGNLRSMVAGATFKLMKQNPEDGEFHGTTHTLGPTGCEFYTLGSQVIRQMNIFHEIGHLLDNVPGTKDIFTHAVEKEGNPIWVSNEVISLEALKSNRITNDPNYPSVQALQTYSNFGSSEQWADAFANYVAGNINLNKIAGIEMFNFVQDSLAPYINTP